MAEEALERDKVTFRTCELPSTSDRIGKGNVIEGVKLNKNEVAEEPLMQSYSSCEEMKPNSNEAKEFFVEQI
ncbi:hypothetical protein MA16_Dca028785 [Dendrobium catenatum]|uniref:Uncharacterized protein n=1 Tax=Dendrobium catenatum TaxID=906689 RepID=A0A2I0V822_9ASPA|nr:hypothetical protein MA16_Dca028785 [Dendrobium catenatum]